MGWPYRPSKLDVKSVYDGMKSRLEQLNDMAKGGKTLWSVDGIKEMALL